MLDCLRDYVGIYGCGRPDPASGLFINALGIPLESIEKLSTPEQQNFLGVWDDVQTRALRRLAMAANGYFSTHYKLNRIAEVVGLGFDDVDPTQTTPADKQWRGFVYNVAVNGTPRSPLQALDLQTLYLYVPTAGLTITVGVFDINTGARFFVKQFTSIVGRNAIPVDANATFASVFIGYYATFDGAQIKIDAASDCDCQCTTDCCDGTITGATVNAATVNDFDVATLATGNNTFGMSAVFSLRCDWQNLICGTKSYWANALWYALGEEMMAERMYSPRLNKFTTIGKDEAKERRDEFKARYHEELQMAVDCITLDTTDCCIECNEPVIKREVCL